MATNLNPRTYRIVGTQRQIDERETPHPRADRGELGERIRLGRKNRHSSDALRRTIVANRDIVKERAVNPQRTPVSDPAAMARTIKEAARFFGAAVVGITHLDQAYVYSHRAKDDGNGNKAGDPIKLTHKYAICMGFAGDFERYMACNSMISAAEYEMGHRQEMLGTSLLATFIRELGYPAQTHGHGGYVLNPIPLAVNAGLGELGRHGMLIHEEYGSRLHLSVVTTDLPLAVDEPVDMGVEEVCKVCMKCAQTCPTYSIPFGDKVVVNGVEKWAIDVDSCYKGRITAGGEFMVCLICTTSCCYHKRSSWWHTLAGWMLIRIPIPLRTLYIKPLLFLDDLIWGKKPWLQMQWMGYDNAPSPVTCSIPGCIAKHKPLEQKPLHKVPKKTIK